MRKQIVCIGVAVVAAGGCAQILDIEDSHVADGGTAAGGDSCPAGIEDVSPKDPGFMTPDTWSAVGMAVIEPLGPGVDPGRAYFHSDDPFDSGGIAQTVPSPEVSCAEPMVMNLQAKVSCEDDGYGGIDKCDGKINLGVGINGGWNVLPIDVPYYQDEATWQLHQVCIGARAFGGSANIFLGPFGERPLDIYPAGSLSLDAITIERDTAGVCPPLGQVPNGDFEDGAAKWTLLPQGKTAEIKAGTGKNGSFGGRLAGTVNCGSSPSIRGTVSIPTSATVPNPALQLWTSTADQKFVVVHSRGISAQPRVSRRRSSTASFLQS